MSNNNVVFEPRLRDRFGIPVRKHTLGCQVAPSVQMRCYKEHLIEIPVPCVSENTVFVTTWGFIEDKPLVNELFQCCFHKGL